jgi:flavin reductase (DIM6/NTAB) family NADH-FMN oxidoreductase RutF
MIDLVRTVKPPHVGESAVSMECSLMHWYDMEDDQGEVTGTVIIGRIKRFHVVS